VLRYPRTLDLVVEPLMELSAAISAGRAAFDWRTAEAALFCVRWAGRQGGCCLCRWVGEGSWSRACRLCVCVCLHGYSWIAGGLPVLVLAQRRYTRCTHAGAAAG
jgi:hypothetical protein